MTARLPTSTWVVLVVAVPVVSVFVVRAAPAVAGEMPPARAGHMPVGGSPMQGLADPFLWWVPLVMLVLWLGLLAGGVYLSYRFVASVASTDSAREALDRAYARGEIADEEYERRRERLDV